MKKTYYTDKFKQDVVNEILDGIIGKDEARRKYGIKGKTSVLNWIRKFDASKTNSMNRKKRVNPVDKDKQELQIENRRLREELDMEQLRCRALNIMIDIAEDHFDIPIRKKSGAKQSGN